MISRGERKILARKQGRRRVNDDKGKKNKLRDREKNNDRQLRKEIKGQRHKR